MSQTTSTATTTAVKAYNQVLNWLKNNRLSADPSKMELMMFTHKRPNRDLTGSNILGTCSGDISLAANWIT
jgi:hypothetical protein